VNKPREVKFDQRSSVAVIPPLLWSGNTPLTQAVAAHVTVHGRLKRGEWFVSVDLDGSGGHLFFRGRTEILPFTVEEKPWKPTS
jgi:hypothetical protein